MRLTTSNSCEDVKQLEFSCIADESVKRYNHLEISEYFLIKLNLYLPAIYS